MKYRDLISFEPINEIVKISKTSDKTYQGNLVKTYVFPHAIKDHILPTITKNLDFYNIGEENFGLQVVGNYGTGKSHLMALVSLIAENEKLLDLISDEEAKQHLIPIAGKYKVLRFELGSTKSLWDVVKYQISKWLVENGISFDFEKIDNEMFLKQIEILMAAIEDKFPDKGFMLVIDEMLAYLKSRKILNSLMKI